MEPSLIEITKKLLIHAIQICFILMLTLGPIIAIWDEVTEARAKKPEMMERGERRQRLEASIREWEKQKRDQEFEREQQRERERLREEDRQRLWEEEHEWWEDEELDLSWDDKPE